ncbi:MAG: DNA gyrase inhibitor YacG [Spongiibacteraceae bacterium]|nr:DNA gyrase inhibitor YacG [Spongiibacteraceae bacterium]
MTSSPTLIQCPSCKISLQWDSQSPNRPFCSESCKNKDFVSWANEEHVLEGNAQYDDILSEDLARPE